MAAEARIGVHTVQDITVVTFEDRSLIDVQAIDEIGEELYGLVRDRRAQKLVLDMGKLVHLSSSALTVLAKLRKLVDGADGTMVLCGLSSEIKRMFKVTALNKLFTFAATQRDALERLGTPTD